MTIFARLFRRGPAADEAAAVYLAIVAQARQPGFFARLGVPDTLDGRFEMIALHAALVIRRLKGGGAGAQALAQEVFDAFFADMDRNLREIGVGDLGVGRKVNQMAEALYGRMAAYDSGLAGGRALLTDALRRNVYGTLDGVALPAAEIREELTTYVEAVAAALDRQTFAEIGEAGPAFPPAPAARN